MWRFFWCQLEFWVGRAAWPAKEITIVAVALSLTADVRRLIQRRNVRSTQAEAGVSD